MRRILRRCECSQKSVRLRDCPRMRKRERERMREGKGRESENERERESREGEIKRGGGILIRSA